MLSFNITYDCRPDIESLAEGFKRWMATIEIDREKYDVKILPCFDHELLLGRLEVTYKEKRLFDVNFYRKYKQVTNGKRVICGMITIRNADDGKEMTRPGDMIHLDINDKLDVNYLGKQTNIAVALQDVLPIRDDEDVKKIVNVFGVEQEHIKMDTYQKRYVIDMPISELQWKEDTAPKEFYKYVSLDVFHKMLLNGTFRMNSIISQSDTQETFYIGDLVCGDYEDEYKRFRGMLAEQKTLISSFTTGYDNAYMWKEYGDNGLGVCLCFRLKGKKKLRQMKYVDEETSPLMRYKRLVDELKEKGVHVHLNAVDDVHRFVKNDRYAKENEWRLVIDYDGEVDYDLYGNRCVSYKDFKFEGRVLPEVGLYLDSIVIGPNLPTGTSNFPLLTHRAHKLFGENLMVNRSMVDRSLFQPPQDNQSV